VAIDSDGSYIHVYQNRITFGTLALATLGLCTVSACSSVHAAAIYPGRVQAQTYHGRPVTLHQYFADHPKVRGATIGAGVGTAAGAVTGLVTGRGVVRGALVGAGAGAGVGLVRSSHLMHRHPILKDVATGSLVGWGLGYAGGRNHGSAARGTLVGAAAGIATGLFVHGL
jgi:hypothetical protein